MVDQLIEEVLCRDGPERSTQRTPFEIRIVVPVEVRTDLLLSYLRRRLFVFISTSGLWNSTSYSWVAAATKMEAELGEDAYKTDVAEAAMATIEENPEFIREILDEWGYGWD